MKHQKNTEREVEQTLESLDGMERATTDDFFYSRLRAKLEHRAAERPGKETSYGFGFAFSVAAIFLLLLMNLISLFQYNITITNNSETTREDVIEELANEYQVLDLNYYEPFEEEVE